MNQREKYEIVFYQPSPDGCPAMEFLDQLPVKARAKLSRWLSELESAGPDLPRPYADIVRGKIRELRMVFASQQIRLLYFFDGKQIVVTHGFIRKTGAVPVHELDRAEMWMKRYFHEKV